MTALHWACKFDNINIVKFLISYNSDANNEDKVNKLFYINFSIMLHH